MQFCRTLFFLLSFSWSQQSIIYFTLLEEELIVHKKSMGNLSNLSNFIFLLYLLRKSWHYGRMCLGKNYRVLLACWQMVLSHPQGDARLASLRRIRHWSGLRFSWSSTFSVQWQCASRALLQGVLQGLIFISAIIICWCLNEWQCYFSFLTSRV